MTVCWLLGCAPAETDRIGVFIGILHERAKHLPGEDRDEIARALVRAERETAVDALLLLAMMEEESRFKPGAKSRRGALGLLQVLPATGRDVAERHQIPWDGPTTLLEPSVNLLIGAKYLAELEQRFGSWDLALTAYNRGPTATRTAEKRGRNPSSRYAARVIRQYDALRQSTEPANSLTPP